MFGRGVPTWKFIVSMRRLCYDSILYIYRDTLTKLSNKQEVKATKTLDLYLVNVNRSNIYLIYVFMYFFIYRFVRDVSFVSQGDSRRTTISFILFY